MSRRQAEFDRLRVEREERINQFIQARKQEREAQRKKIFYVRSEEERLRKLHEEEEARKREGRWMMDNIANSYIFFVHLIESLSLEFILFQNSSTFI